MERGALALRKKPAPAFGFGNRPARRAYGHRRGRRGPRGPGPPATPSATPPRPLAPVFPLARETAMRSAPTAALLAALAGAACSADPARFVPPRLEPPRLEPVGVEAPSASGGRRAAPAVSAASARAPAAAAGPRSVAAPRIAPGGRLPESSAGGAGAPVLVAYDVRLLTTPVRDFPGPRLGLTASGFEPREEEPAEPRAAVDGDTLLALVEENVAPDTWDLEGRSLALHRGVLLVRQTPDVHRRLAVLLGRLGAF